MTGYNIVNLADVIKLKSEAESAYNTIQDAISAFCCPHNEDVERFLKKDAEEFAKQGIAATYLIFAPYKGKPVLVGYFTLANKYLVIPNKKIESKNWKRRVAKFGTYDEISKGYNLSIPLIAQLGKNFQNGYNTLITGDELLKLACDKIQQIQLMMSGKMTYVECEDKPFLIDFYQKNGFRIIGNRTLNVEEKKSDKTDYLVQLIKYLH